MGIFPLERRYNQHPFRAICRPTRTATLHVRHQQQRKKVHRVEERATIQGTAFPVPNPSDLRLPLCTSPSTLPSVLISLNLQNHPPQHPERETPPADLARLAETHEHDEHDRLLQPARDIQCWRSPDLCAFDPRTLLTHGVRVWLAVLCGWRRRWAGGVEFQGDGGEW